MTCRSLGYEGFSSFTSNNKLIQEHLLCIEIHLNVNFYILKIVNDIVIKVSLTICFEIVDFKPQS